MLRNLKILSALALMVLGLDATSARAQTAEWNPKPPMFTFMLDWAIPLQGTADMNKQQNINAGVLQKAFASGQLLGYGTNEFFIHAQGMTHRTFWNGDSLTSVLKMYEELKKAGALSAPVLRTATVYYPRLFVSRYYNSKPGAKATAGYSYQAVFQFVPGAPADALEIAAKSFLVPMFEKMLAEGSIDQYQISTEGGYHTTNPRWFFISFSGPNTEVYEGFERVAGAFYRGNSWVETWWIGWNEMDKHFDYLSNISYELK
jgi:hypothetical protein